MKRLFSLLLVFVLAFPLYAQEWPLGATRTTKMVTLFSSTGAETTADATPTCDVIEDVTSPPIVVGGSMTLYSGITSATNLYYIQLAVTSGNGYEVGKSYNVICKAAVGGLTQDIVSDYFRVVPTENTTGYRLTDVALMNNISTSSITNVNANQGTTQPLNFTGTGASALVRNDTRDWNGTAVTTPNTAGTPVVDVGRINNVSTSSVTTVNANQGTTQPVNFTGTGSSANIKVDAQMILAAAINTSTAQIGANLVAWKGTAAATPDTAGYPVVTIKDGTGTGEIDTNAGGVITRQLTVAAIANMFNVDSLTTYGAAVGGSLVKEIADNAAPGSAQTIVTGTSDSGSTTTMVDAARTEADADYWKGDIICFTSGNISGQCRTIEDFNAGTDTITFAPATTQAVATQNYGIYRMISVWDSTMAEHTAANTTGASLNGAASAGDPWTTALPGAYGGGTAGQIVGQVLFNAATTVGTINTNVSSALTRLPAALTADGNMKADTLRVNGTSQTAGDIMATLNLLQVLQKGVAYSNYPVFMRQQGTAATGVTGATVTCTRSISNGAGFSSFSSTGISGITEVGNGFYSIDLDATVIGNTTIIRCTATGGSGTADPFIQTIFSQR